MPHLRSSCSYSLRFVLVLCAIVLPMSANAFWWYDDDDDDDDAEELKTITEIVLESGGAFDRNRRDYDILLNAVLAAGLEGVLDDPDADLTVLAPDDGAFIRLAQALGYHGRDEAGAFDFIVAALTDLGGGDPIPVLTNILLYHVSPEEKNLRDLNRDPKIDTALEGASIYLYFFNELVDKEPELSNPKIRFARSNIQASNGIIHTLTRVLIPVDLPNSPEDLPTIAEIVAASGGDFDRNRRDYDILLNAVIAADLVDALSDESADLTVFAPNDIAFIRLARTLGYRGFNEERAFNFIVDTLTELGNGDPIPLLTDVLLYHVSPDSQTLNHVIFSDEIITLLGDASFVPNGLTLIDEDPGTRNPRMIPPSSDIRASNGVIHTLNRVLLPLSVSGH